MATKRRKVRRNTRKKRRTYKMLDELIKELKNK